MNTYEKKYKEALEKAKSMIDDLRKGEDILAVSNLETMFPELKESDDERIRKELLESFKYQQRESRTDKEWLNGIKLSEVVAWLEKQGEQKPIFNVVDWQPSKVDGKIHNIYNSGVEPKFIEKKELRKIENSPILSNSAKTGKNWSEEDEKCIDNCCLLIGAADNCYEKTFKDDCIHYLQNLKQRMGV